MDIRTIRFIEQWLYEEEVIPIIISNSLFKIEIIENYPDFNEVLKHIDKLVYRRSPIFLWKIYRTNGKFAAVLYLLRILQNMNVRFSDWLHLQVEFTDDLVQMRNLDIPPCVLMQYNSCSGFTNIVTLNQQGQVFGLDSRTHLKKSEYNSIGKKLTVTNFSCLHDDNLQFKQIEICDFGSAMLTYDGHVYVCGGGDYHNLGIKDLRSSFIFNEGHSLTHLDYLPCVVKMYLSSQMFVILCDDNRIFACGRKPASFMRHSGRSKCWTTTFQELNIDLKDEFSKHSEFPVDICAKNCKITVVTNKGRIITSALGWSQHDCKVIEPVWENSNKEGNNRSKIIFDWIFSSEYFIVGTHRRNNIIYVERKGTWIQYDLDDVLIQLYCTYRAISILSDNKLLTILENGQVKTDDIPPDTHEIVYIKKYTMWDTDDNCQLWNSLFIK